MPTVTCCMIVKDEEQLLPSAIETIEPLVDEVVIAVDTKSQDKTKEIAETAARDNTKIKVYDFVWQDDFSAARNFAIEKASSEWILCLDADERVSKNDLEDLKKAIEKQNNREKKQEDTQQKEQIVAFSFMHRYYTNKKDAYPGWKPLKKETKVSLTEAFTQITSFNGFFDIFPVTYFFKNDRKIRFSGKIHEDVQPSIATWNKNEPKKVIVQTRMPIHHFHFLKNDSFTNTKQEYYFNLSKQKYEEHPDAKIALDLTAGYIFFENNKEKSFASLLNVLEHQGVKREHITKIKIALKKKKEIPALHAMIQLLDVKKHNANDVFNLVKAYYKQEHYKLALVVLKRLLLIAPKHPVTIEYMAVCYDKLIMYTDAIKILEHGISVHPTNAQFYFNLGALYEKVKDYAKAVAAFNYAINNNHPMMQQLQQRITMLRNVASGQHIEYNITVGDTNVK